MVCVKSVKLLLDEFILQGNCEKVNIFERAFTICLHPSWNVQVSFQKNSKKCNRSVIELEGGAVI